MILQGLRNLAVLAFLVIASSTPQFAIKAIGADPFTETQRRHWSFQPVERPPIPTQLDSVNELQNPIDQFITSQLRQDGRELSSPAARRTLLRRVTFDLIGLPPTPSDLEDFVQDQSPDAFERAVDRLISSPHFGETWGRVWLDVVRFAETAGFKEDPVRPNAYTYRDYIIRSFNDDLPFDRFIADQIAGDEMFPDNADSQAATGYCRMWPDESNASNIRLARQTALDDLTANVGAAFLGLSVGCAQCHDHKFDPILQTDFYQLQAFFSGIVLEDKVPVGTIDQLADFHRQNREWLVETASLRQELNQLERPARIKMQGERRMKFPADVLQALDMPIEDRDTMQRQLAFWSARQMGVKEDDIPKHLDDEARKRRDELLERMSEALTRKPRPQQEAAVMAVTELTNAPPSVHRMENGSYDKPKEEVQPNFPVVLRSDDTPIAVVPPTNRSSGRRTVLAKWLGASTNPLTHRVWVNRLWQGHFGHGLVSNANDFGTQAHSPRHLNLMNWLTREFIESGFESKRIHRLVVTSATYRQSTSTSAAEGNTWDGQYDHYPRRRLSAERIRDALLASSGELNDSLYGRGIRPELPPNYTGYEWQVSPQAAQNRRSIYIFAKRNLPYPLMAAFDFPDMHESCGCRTTTTIAPQALILLNNNVVLRAARDLAERAKTEATSADPAQAVQRAWQLALGRSASDNEVTQAMRFVAQQHELVSASNPAEGSDAQQSEIANEAFADFCHALLNTNEFLFIE